jgi:hypothetical protein
VDGDLVVFENLPLVADHEHIRRVHNDAGLYLLNKSRLTAHGSPFECAEVTPERVVNNPAWRVATDAQVRSLGGGWCTRCS